MPLDTDEAISYCRTARGAKERKKKKKPEKRKKNEKDSEREVEGGV